MKLSNFIKDVGRIVAYYPGLKKITGSTTATILLSQFLYWTDKTGDGWIWKSADEIEEETGLTYNEQKTARRELVYLGLIQQERKRLDHSTKYKVNIETMNRLWEEHGGKKVEKIVEEEEPAPVETPIPAPPTPKLEKKGDLMDGILFYAGLEGEAKIKKMDEIRAKIHLNLHVNPDNKKWQDFIEYAYKRQEKFNEPFDKFIAWAIEAGFSPIYWTPEKMITMYPQAYVEDKKAREDFVGKLPEAKEEEYVEVPREMRTKR